MVPSQQPTTTTTKTTKILKKDGAKRRPFGECDKPPEGCQISTCPLRGHIGNISDSTFCTAPTSPGRGGEHKPSRAPKGFCGAVDVKVEDLLKGSQGLPVAEAVAERAKIGRAGGGLIEITRAEAGRAEGDRVKNGQPRCAESNHTRKGQKDEDEEALAYWSTYVAKTWLYEWFGQKPMQAWTIDNYDGRDSYEEFDLKLSKKHWDEPPLEPKLFQETRDKMTFIEAEMDEVLDGSNQTSKEDRAKGWPNLKKVTLSICDDCVPGVQTMDPEEEATIAYGHLQNKMRRAGGPPEPGKTTYAEKQMQQRTGNQPRVRIPGRIC